MKLVVIMTLIPVSSAQAERLFSSMNFIQNDQRNRLDEPHLNDTVRLYKSRFTIENFPFDVTLDIWMNLKERRS